jgi:hypothetical protein
MDYKFTEIHHQVPDHDCDFIINFPGGKQLVIQLRPGNAYGDYNGSLDIILPYNQPVACFKGDDLEEAKPIESDLPNHLYAKQIIAELPTY